MVSKKDYIVLVVILGQHPAPEAGRLEQRAGRVEGRADGHVGVISGGVTAGVADRPAGGERRGGEGDGYE